MSAEIKTLGSKTVYANRWMTVREDAIERPSGHTGIYGVVEKADFAVIAAVQDRQMYLVEQYRYPVAGRYWELPQGSWESSAIAPAALAAAELREETGLIANDIRHVGHLFLAYGYSTQGYDIFFATDLTQSSAQIEPEEHGLVTQPFTVDDVEQMILAGQIKDATTVAAFGLLKMKGLI
ncbi:NUDIX domain-containing protein [Cellvibrio sp. ARAG 10.3]|uniref:NUDIX domain-containing protein n=1 Tax=Cellvibrio sp. ARAG 10.3 TaxID=3451358 RepID=UPI003F4454AF